MKKMMLVLYIVFAVLTFLGAGYVLYTGGKANAGHAVVPMLFGLIFLMQYRKTK